MIGFHSRHGFLEVRQGMERRYSVHVAETGRLLHTFYGDDPVVTLTRGQIASLMNEAYRAGREDAPGLYGTKQRRDW